VGYAPFATERMTLVDEAVIGHCGAVESS